MLKDVSRGASESTDVMREPVALIFSAVRSMGHQLKLNMGE